MNIDKDALRILCYGDSNTWGWIPSKMGQERFDVSKRWTGVLQEKLGKEYEIIEEGLGGRNTVSDDDRVGFEERNGAKTLPIVLESHLPLEKVIVMLGTTETKEMMDMSAKDIAGGVKKLIKIIKNYRTLKDILVPEVIVIIPPVIIDTTDFASVLFKGGTKKSKELIGELKQVCLEESVKCVDSNEIIKVDKVEGIHIDEINHKKLGELIYENILSA